MPPALGGDAADENAALEHTLDDDELEADLLDYDDNGDDSFDLPDDLPDDLDMSDGDF